MIFSPFLQILMDIDEAPAQLSPLEAEQVQLPQPILVREAPEINREKEKNTILSNFFCIWLGL